VSKAGFMRRTPALPVILAMSLSPILMSACSPEAESAATSASDSSTEVLVRGAAPGGMTASWEADGGDVSLVLDDMGRATYRKKGNGEIDGTWLMSAPTEGDVNLSDGQAMRLVLDESSDTLSAIPIVDGKEGQAMRLSRVSPQPDMKPAE